MDCNTLQVIQGSILTFETITRLYESPIPPSDITTNSTFEFNDYLSDGLKIDDSNTVEVYFSKDNINYKKIINFNKVIIPYPEIGSNLGYYLGVIIPISEIKFYPIFIKVSFSTTVYDIDKLLSTNATTQYPTLNNTATFYAQANPPDSPLINSTNVTLSSIPIKQYSPEVSGYSITICPSENDGKFEAKLCLNTICGEYKNGQYVLNITAPDGISFYEDATSTPPAVIKAYTGCCCTSNPIMINTIQPVPLVDNTKTAIITIKHSEIKESQKNDTNDSCNNNISIYIPCKIENTTTACTKDYLIITGSIEFQDIIDPNIPITLVKLKNFVLYINIDCGNVIGIGKTILC